MIKKYRIALCGVLAFVLGGLWGYMCLTLSGNSTEGLIAGILGAFIIGSLVGYFTPVE